MIWFVCAVLGQGSAALAGPPIVEDIAWLPADVDFVLSAHNLSALKDTPLGQSANTLVQTGIALGGAQQSETLQAWRSLSQKLGMGESQAFDALLGQRLIFASRIRDDDKRDWIVNCRTTAKTAMLIRKKLDVAPREIKHDRVLMSLEGGAYRLGSMIDGDHAWLLLAQTGSDGLFNQITNADGQPEWQRLGMRQPIDDLRTLGDGELAIYTTLNSTASDAWLGLVARADDDAIRFRMVSDPGKPLPAVIPWSTTVFDELRDGSLLAHMERIPTPDQIDAMETDEPGSGSIVAAARSLLEIPHRVLGQDLKLILGNRLAVAAHTKPEGGVSFCTGIEASDVKALADPGDAAMRSVIESVAEFYNAREASFDFVGTLPRAVRTISLRSRERGKQLPPFGETLAVSWSFRDSPGLAPAGWWVVGTDQAALKRCAEALTGGAVAVDDGDSAAWLLLFEAHPMSLIQSMQEGNVRIPPILAPLLTIDTIEIKTWIDTDREDEIVRGAGSVRFTAP